MVTAAQPCSCQISRAASTSAACRSAGARSALLPAVLPGCDPRRFHGYILTAGALRMQSEGMRLQKRHCSPDDAASLRSHRGRRGSPALTLRPLTTLIPTSRPGVLVARRIVATGLGPPRARPVRGSADRRPWTGRPGKGRRVRGEWVRGPRCPARRRGDPLPPRQRLRDLLVTHPPRHHHAAVAGRPGCRSSPATTGLRPRTGSRPRPTTCGRRTTGCSPRGTTPSGSSSRATPRAATSPSTSPSS